MSSVAISPCKVGDVGLFKRHSDIGVEKQEFLQSAHGGHGWVRGSAWAVILGLKETENQ